MILRAVAKTAESSGAVQQVELLGHDGPLEFEHTEKGLSVQLPHDQPCEHAWGLRISGQYLRSFDPQEKL